MWDSYWKGRGSPWEFDPGPPAAWAQLFAETPNYRGLGVGWSGKELFRWQFGPMFYRGRLAPGSARVLVVGQEGAQDESLAHRSFVGGTGGQLQHLLAHLGITRSYLFLNTFVYPIFGQYDAKLRPLAQDLRSPIAAHRQALFDLAAQTLDLRLVVAVGAAAKESVATWVRSHGGHADPAALHNAEAHRVRPGLRAVGVLHPGGASKGAAVSAIAASFQGRPGPGRTVEPGRPGLASGRRRRPAEAGRQLQVLRCPHPVLRPVLRDAVAARLPHHHEQPAPGPAGHPALLLRRRLQHRQHLSGRGCGQRPGLPSRSR